MADELKTKQKNLLLTFQECAREVKGSNPKLAYFCRLYGVDQALNLGTKDINPVIKEFITSELQELESIKTSLGITQATRDKDGDLCREFAKMVFVKADKLDRSGLPQHVPTAGVSFKRAAQFFRVASQFGALPENLAQLRKYAALRSIELIKAHKEGRMPEPPPAREPGALSADADADLMDALNSLAAVPGASSQAPPAAPLSFPAAAPAAAAALPPPSPLQGAISAQTPPPREFQPGDTVLYCPNATVNCIKELGTVQSVGQAPGGDLIYTILLSNKRKEVTVPGEFLAPNINAGEHLVFYPDDGSAPEEVEVEEVYGSQWPPTYLVKREGSGLVMAEDERLAKRSSTESEVVSTTLGTQEKVPFSATEAAADLAAERLAAEAVAAAAAHPEEHDDLSTIGETHHEDDEEDSEEEGAKSTSSSVAAAALAEEVIAAAHIEQVAGAQAPFGSRPFDLQEIPPESPLAAGPVYAAPPVAANGAPKLKAAPPQPAVAAAPPPAPPQQYLPSAPPPPPPPAASAYMPPTAFSSSPGFAVYPPPMASPPAAPAASVPVHSPAASGPASHAVQIDPNYEPSLEAMMEAQKAAKSAGSALNFEDTPTAIKYLQSALEMLTRPGAHQPNK